MTYKPSAIRRVCVTDVLRVALNLTVAHSARRTSFPVQIY